MTTLVLSAAPFIAMVKPQFRVLGQYFSIALETIVKSRMRKAQRKIDRMSR